MFYHGITPEYLSSQGINPEGLTFGSYFLPYNQNLKQFGRKLRQGYQIAEVKLWKCLRAKNMGYSFRRQYPNFKFCSRLLLQATESCG